MIVGIDTYPDAPLRGCRNDAESIAECLSISQYAYDCAVLLDQDATRPAILSTLGARAYGDGKGGVLVFYFAGHGQVLGDQAHLVSVDGTQFDPGISLAHIAQLMESASAHYRHVVTILDSCHSGAAFTWTNSRPLQAVDIERGVHTVNESRCVLAACRPEQLANEVAGHGVFTAALLEGLLGDAANENGDITILNLFEYATSQMSDLEQVPVFKGDFAGTVALGSGFPSRTGKPLSTADRSKELAKAHALLDEYHYRSQIELSNADHRDREGLRACAIELEPIIKWFDDTEHGSASIVTDKNWQALRRDLSNYQAALAPFRLGQRIVEGELVEKLGVGGFGNVWRVLNTNSDEIAYKIYHPSELFDEVKVQRFINGYSNMRKLDHPRIVAVKKLSVAPLGIVMDYVPGANLRQAYFDRADPTTCLRVLRDVAETVEHAHLRGVRHRDIKPENIIIAYNERSEPVPYLTDFDLAYHQTNRTVTAMFGVGGVLNYAAPEQLYTPTAAAARAVTVDIFSIAQLAFFIITGEDPASGNIPKNEDRLRKVLNGWTEQNSATILLDLYVQCSQKNPEDRPQSMSEFSGAILRAEAFASAASNTATVLEKDFCERLAFLYSGVDSYSTTGNTVSLASLSQQVSILIRNKGTSLKGHEYIDLEFELSVTGTLPVGAVTSGSSGRKSLNQRLDKVLARYPNATRHPGNKGTFQTYVAVKNVPLSTSGVASALEVLNAVVACVDGAF